MMDGHRTGMFRPFGARSFRAKYSRTSGCVSSETSVPAASRFTVSSFAVASRVKATFRCASLIPTSTSVRPGIAGGFSNAARQSAVAGRSNRPNRRRMATARAFFEQSLMPVPGTRNDENVLEWDNGSGGGRRVAGRSSLEL